MHSQFLMKSVFFANVKKIFGVFLFENAGLLQTYLCWHYFSFVFLVGWDKIDPQSNEMGGSNSIKQQLIMLFYTARNIGICKQTYLLLILFRLK